MRPQEPPVIDFGPYYSSDPEARKNLVERLRNACEEFGFFQLINHKIPSSHQQSIINQSKDLFNLPIETKEKYAKDIGGFNRGYEHLRAQNFEKRTKGDLKEGFYLGKNLSEDNNLVTAKKCGQGPNKYPVEVEDPQTFQHVMDEYHTAMTSLSQDILHALAWTLDLEDDFFSAFSEDPVATLRLLHYPPQDPATVNTERGIGAHTDFGAVTILLQDQTGGLQVWNSSSTEWVDVTPLAGAYVVNLGNLMMRWTNDRYLSIESASSDQQKWERALQCSVFHFGESGLCCAVFTGLLGLWC